MQKARTDVIVVRSAKVIFRRAGSAAIIQQHTPSIFKVLGFRRPFAKPRPVVANARLQPQPNAVHFPDLGSGPRCRIQTDRKSVGPTAIVGKIPERQVGLIVDGTRHGLATASRFRCPLAGHRSRFWQLPPSPQYNVGNHTQLLYGIAMDFLQCDISKGCDRNVRTAARKLRV